jgi:hypothetical protein
MRFEEAVLESDAPKAKIVLVCHEADKDETISILNAYAACGWQEHGEIYLLETGSRVQYVGFRDAGTLRRIRQNPVLLRKTLDSIAPPSEAARIIAVGSVSLELDPPPGDWRTLTPVRSTSELRTSLSKHLSAGGLDWMSKAVTALSDFHIGLNRSAITAWREQFLKFKFGSWVGDALLKLLDFWPTARTTDALFSTSDPGGEELLLTSLEQYSAITFIRAETGDSSSMMCRLAKNKIGVLLQKRRADFSTFVKETTSPASILLIEDCLITGTEIIKLFRNLPMESLRRHRIDLQFAAGTRFGEARLISYLQSAGLTNGRILRPPGGFLPNLSAAGEAKFSSNNLFDGKHEMIGTSLDLVTGLQLRARPYFNSTQRKDIEYVCKAICTPLMNAHLLSKGWKAHEIEAVMPSWQLGYSGLGLLLAFSHGVPKPALPLFWVEADIDVKLDGQTIRVSWKPLFPRPIS